VAPCPVGVLPVEVARDTRVQQAFESIRPQSGAVWKSLHEDLESLWVQETRLQEKHRLAIMAVNFMAITAIARTLGEDSAGQLARLREDQRRLRASIQRGLAVVGESERRVCRYIDTRRSLSRQLNALLDLAQSVYCEAGESAAQLPPPPLAPTSTSSSTTESSPSRT
jgi:hypothetical protein